MFRASVLLSLATLALGLANGDLRVSVKAVSSSVRSVDDIVLTAVVTNPTAADVRVLKIANVLDTNPTDSFAVTKVVGSNSAESFAATTSEEEEAVEFIGAIAYPDFTNEANYVTIPAGQSIAVNHTLSALYNFEGHGPGSYKFAPWTIFQSGPDSDAIVVDIEPVTIEISEDVARRSLFEEHLVARGSTPNCNDATKLQRIRDALANSKDLARGATAHINNVPNSLQYPKFFSGVDKQAVKDRFNWIANDKGNRQVYCNRDPANLCNNGAAAYVMLSLSGGNILASDAYMCNGFFNFQPTGDICKQNIDDINNSRGGVMLHEMSHATAATTDHIYGCRAVRNLNAQQKLSNADNFQCMALAVWRVSRC